MRILIVSLLVLWLMYIMYATGRATGEIRVLKRVARFLDGIISVHGSIDKADPKRMLVGVLEVINDITERHVEKGS